MSASTANHSARDAREVVALACSIGGRKRGWHLAASLLGVSERVVKAIAYGEAARPDARAVAMARLTLAEQRLAQIEAEAEQLRGLLHAARQPVDVAW